MLTLTFGERLSVLRKRQDLTQEKLSQMSGVSRVHIARLERGGRGSPGMEVIERLCAALDVPFSDLTGYELARVRSQV